MLPKPWWVGRSSKFRVTFLLLGLCRGGWDEVLSLMRRMVVSMRRMRVRGITILISKLV